MTVTASSPLVRQTREALGVSRKTFSRLTGYSERAIAAWEGGESLSPKSRQRLLEMHRLQRGLAGVMEAEAIGDWLETPNPAFERLKPLEVIERGEIDRVWQMIFLLESGDPS
jgi:transcriptional regulator with XRE-family HTH domain